MSEEEFSEEDFVDIVQNVLTDMYISGYEDAVAANQVLVVSQPMLKPGSIVHVRLGIQDMGDGMPPWLPGSEELEAAKEEWEKVLPEGVRVIVTHFGEQVDTVLGVE